MALFLRESCTFPRQPVPPSHKFTQDVIFTQTLNFLYIYDIIELNAGFTDFNEAMAIDRTAPDV